MDRVVPRQKRAMKHVHQHRLAATNTAMDIESGDVTVPRGEARQPATRRRRGQPVQKDVQSLRHRHLALIVRQVAGGDPRSEGGADALLGIDGGHVRFRPVAET